MRTWAKKQPRGGRSQRGLGDPDRAELGGRGAPAGRPGGARAPAGEKEAGEASWHGRRRRGGAAPAGLGGAAPATAEGRDGRSCSGGGVGGSPEAGRGGTAAAGRRREAGASERRRRRWAPRARSGPGGPGAVETAAGVTWRDATGRERRRVLSGGGGTRPPAERRFRVTGDCDFVFGMPTYK